MNKLTFLRGYLTKLGEAEKLVGGLADNRKSKWRNRMGNLEKKALKAPNAKNISDIISKVTPKTMLNLPFALMGNKKAIKFDKKFNKLFDMLKKIKRMEKTSASTGGVNIVGDEVEFYGYNEHSPGDASWFLSKIPYRLRNTYTIKTSLKSDGKLNDAILRIPVKEALGVPGLRELTLGAQNMSKVSMNKKAGKYEELADIAANIARREGVSLAKARKMLSSKAGKEAQKPGGAMDLFYTLRDIRKKKHMDGAIQNAKKLDNILED